MIEPLVCPWCWNIVEEDAMFCFYCMRPLICDWCGERFEMDDQILEVGYNFVVTPDPDDYLFYGRRLRGVDHYHKHCAVEAYERSSSGSPTKPMKPFGAQTVNSE